MQDQTLKMLKNKKISSAQHSLAVLREQWAHWRYFEYWPTRLFYLPIYPLIAYYALRFRSVQFMAAVNPCMEFGGLLNYSKSKILERLPKDKTLQSCLVSCREDLQKILSQMAACGLAFPIIAKPDCGERGFGVELLSCSEALAAYLTRFQAVGSEQLIILQEYFHPAKEFAVLYSLGQKTGQIRSISAKEPISVRGDGVRPLWQLVAQDTRGSQRFSMLRRKWQHCWNKVLDEGQELQLTNIGAHSLGTTCYNLEEKNSKQVLELFAELTAHINTGPVPVFCFGRYDILAKDWESVLAGNFKVIELNGVNAEPVHIYHPKYSLWQAWKTLWAHWKHIAQLAREMQAKGAKFGSSKLLLQAIWAHDKKIKAFARLK